ncbi:Protein Tube [Habropoda laboriosa]|uniref:Protein Tube n=1 Tax=Habropoda laboriosa TaxID=597456 RepID=A0A0L7R3D7_9HYME|nr:PREDICTED: protein Tube [Habropoda laboriosa]KOC65338.1 Protein Tube [Habropoda laboriosa]
MSRSIICWDTELRKLRPAELYKLGQILNISDSWKKLMAIVPKEDACNLPKFTTEHFSMIEQAAQQQRRSAAEIFLSEWGTMGKNRPTLRTLLNLLVKAELFRAADYVAGDILNDELPKRPECGPAAPVDISDEVINKLLEEKEGLQNFGFNESLIFGLPSEDNETVNPNAMNNSLERNMQSTKLVSANGKHDENHSENIKETTNSQISDLMKFSTKQNIEGFRGQEHVYEQQEMSSRELPVFLNEFGRIGEQTKLNQEVLSEELPVFLNNNSTASNNILCNVEINNSFHLSNLNINENEMTSIELPQCIVELRVNNASNSVGTHSTENNKNTAQNVLNSQELPITVLEYNA